MRARNKPPAKNPMRAGAQLGSALTSGVMAMAGANSDQKLAAIITPAAKPIILSRTFWLIRLKKKTKPAPNAVTPQVNSVAIKACITGLKPSKNVITLSIGISKNIV